MEMQRFYSKFTKISKPRGNKNASITITDEYLNGFEDRDIFVEVSLIKKKEIKSNKEKIKWNAHNVKDIAYHIIKTVWYAWDVEEKI